MENDAITVIIDRNALMKLLSDFNSKTMASATVTFSLTRQGNLIAASLKEMSDVVTGGGSERE